MNLRSMLFVPADSEKKLEKARTCGADALIFDLEDAVAPGRKAVARAMCAAHLRQCAGQYSWKAFVRINPLSTPEALDDLAAVVGAGIDGIVLPKVYSVDDIALLSAYLDALEVGAGLVRGRIRIVVVATETARAMLQMDGYRGPSPRLLAITWGAEDLSSAIGALDNCEQDATLSHLYLMARSMCLLAASATEALPIDTLYADYRDLDGLAADCVASRRRGFAGRIAIHPDQVAIINQSYMPSEDEMAASRAIVDAFAASPDQGAVGIGGRMYDRPHLKQAQRVLQAAAALPAAAPPVSR